MRLIQIQVGTQVRLCRHTLRECLQHSLQNGVQLCARSDDWKIIKEPGPGLQEHCSFYLKPKYMDTLYGLTSMTGVQGHYRYISFLQDIESKVLATGQVQKVKGPAGGLPLPVRQMPLAFAASTAAATPATGAPLIPVVLCLASAFKILTYLLKVYLCVY